MELRCPRRWRPPSSSLAVGTLSYLLFLKSELKLGAKLQTWITAKLEMIPPPVYVTFTSGFG